MTKPPRIGKRTKAFLAAVAGVGLALLVLEAGLRFLLFSQTARELGIGWRLRDAALYTPREAGRETWKLRALIQERPDQALAKADARFGWLSPDIDPVSFAHADETLVGARRPLLLFGDSYAQCVPESGRPWQDLMEDDPLSARFRLLNYGVSGYGLDQMVLLLKAVLPRFRERDPLVVIGILVDDDLDRSYLALRGRPKPFFTLESNDLVLHPVEQVEAQDYLRAHPLDIQSYLWRWCLFGSGLVSRRAALAWTDETDHVAVKQAVNRRILDEMLTALQGVSHFFVLFHGQRALETPGPFSWQEPFLYSSFDELGISFVTSKRFLRSRMAATGARTEDYVLQSGPGLGHYTPAAVEVVFGALRDGLEGRFEPYAYMAER